MDSLLSSRVVDGLAEVDRLRGARDRLRPLDAERRERIWQKFRLDWNYHSNAIEGNSLDYGETRAFLMHGITAKGKPLKDYLDIRGHNQVIGFLEDFVKRDAVLTEAHIREMHKLVLAEPYEIDARTPNGGVTRKRVIPGEYKTLPNHVETRTGELHFFAAPEEVGMRMGELLAWYRQARADESVHPVVVATRFHHEFVSIHPFDDGNGRMARILMNLLLMERDYLPAVIRTEQRNEYYLALAQADGGNLAPLVELVIECERRALDTWLRGARGESIEEPNDLDKGLSLLEQKLTTAPDVVHIARSQENVEQLLTGPLRVFFREFDQVLAKFERFFLKPRDRWIAVLNNQGYLKVADARSLADDLLSAFDSKNPYLIVAHRFQTFRSEPDPFDIGIRLDIHFGEFRYDVKLSFSDPREIQFPDSLICLKRIQQLFTKKYHEDLSTAEIDLLADRVGKEFLAYVNARHDAPTYGELPMDQDELTSRWQVFLRANGFSGIIIERRDRSIAIPVKNMDLIIINLAAQFHNRLWKTFVNEMHYFSLELI